MSKKRLSLAPLAAGKARNRNGSTTLNDAKNTPQGQENQATRVFISRCGLHFENKNLRRSFVRLFFVEPVEQGDDQPYWLESFETFGAAERWCEQQEFLVDFELSAGTSK
jgi:hypothetical protein